MKDTFSFGIKTFDQLYPICPDGFHRSQVLYLVLKGIKRLLGNPDGVALPHGARSGYDPFVLRDTPNDPVCSVNILYLNVSDLATTLPDATIHLHVETERSRQRISQGLLRGIRPRASSSSR